MTPETLRDDLRRELFDVVLPFWERHGIDDEHGGFMTRLDHDGARVDDTKFHWFQGRGLWIYSFLYTQFGRRPEHLEVARKAKDFMLRHMPQPDGWWAELLARDGRVLRPYQGDYYGMYFGAEGLFEYSHATGDQAAFDTARALLLKLFRVPEPHPQGFWMVNMLISSSFLQRWKDPQIQAIADECLEAITQRHYNQETGLNMEMLAEPDRCVFGHSIECYWMAAEEARRRQDWRLWQLCADRIRHHLDVGWDHIFGGLANSIKVGDPCFEWPLDRPVGTGVELSARGEINYNKYFWAVNETMVAALLIWERTRAEWAWRYCELALDVTRRKFSLKERGYPLYLLFTDRRFSFQPKQTRQDNYHLPRQLMLNVLTLDRASRNPGDRASQNAGPAARC